MIWVLKMDKATAFSCDTDEELFKHIMAIENAKLLVDHPEFGQTTWSFVIYSLHHVANLCNHGKPSAISAVFTEAYQKQFGVIEIYKGNIYKPVEIIMEPHLDIPALKKEWCLAYCETHHYKIIERDKPCFIDASQSASTNPDLTALSSLSNSGYSKNSSQINHDTEYLPQTLNSSTKTTSDLNASVLSYNLVYPSRLKH